MKVRIVPYKVDHFAWHPRRPGKASRGYCSRYLCYRPAHVALEVIGDSRAHWAVCHLHLRLFQMLGEINGLRLEIREGNEQGNIIEIRTA